MSIQITIHGDNAAEALIELSTFSAGIKGGQASTAVAVGTPTTQPEQYGQPAYQQQPIYQPPSQAPMQAPMQAPVQPAYGAVPVQQPVQQQPIQQQPPQGVPTATQAYDMQQLAVAATALIDAGRHVEVTNLLNQQFGVGALTALPKERYGEFATALRAMGARI